MKDVINCDAPLITALPAPEVVYSPGAIIAPVVATIASGIFPPSQVSNRPPAADPFDVATLMHAPLANLLLAAFCKDPDGTRRTLMQAMQRSRGRNTVPAPDARKPFF